MVETKTVLITPPEYMLKPCTKTPTPKKGTNKDLVEYTLNLQADFKLCNKKLRLLREYYKNNSHPAEPKGSLAVLQSPATFEQKGRNQWKK